MGHHLFLSVEEELFVEDPPNPITGSHLIQSRFGKTAGAKFFLKICPLRRGKMLLQMWTFCRSSGKIKNVILGDYVLGTAPV